MRGRSGKKSRVCACEVGGERKDSQREERERKRETRGSWRNIQEGGIEEECVSGERKKEEAGIGIHTYGIRILCSPPPISRLIPSLSVRRK